MAMQECCCCFSGARQASRTCSLWRCFSPTHMVSRVELQAGLPLDTAAHASPRHLLLCPSLCPVPLMPRTARVAGAHTLNSSDWTCQQSVSTWPGLSRDHEQGSWASCCCWGMGWSASLELYGGRQTSRPASSAACTGNHSPAGCAEGVPAIREDERPCGCADLAEVPPDSSQQLTHLPRQLQRMRAKCQGHCDQRRSIWWEEDRLGKL